MSKLTAVLIFFWLSLGQAKEFTLLAEDAWYPYSGAKNREIYKAEGFALDLITAAYSAAGHTVSFQTVPYSRCLDQVKKDISIGCFDVGKNKEIEAQFNFPKYPLFTARSDIYTLVENPVQKMTIKDLYKVGKVGVVRDAQYSDEFDLDKKIERAFARNDPGNADMLAAKRFKYAILFDLPLAAYIKEKPALAGRFKAVGLIAKTDFWIAFSKNHPMAKEAMAEFDKGMEIIIKDGRLKSIQDKWK